jgi:hypothetical protein
MDSRLTFPGNRLDQRQRRRLPVCGVVIVSGRGQLRKPRTDLLTEPGRHAQGQRLLGLVQGRADDPVTAARRWRFDPLRATAGQQLLPHPVSAPLGLADAGSALPEPEVAAELRAVVLDRAASPLIEPEVGCRDADLPGDERDRLVV